MQLFTRDLDLEELRAIGMAVIEQERQSAANNGYQFKCRHFAYQFVRAIVDQNARQLLANPGNWPRNLQEMDGHISGNLGGQYAFGDLAN